MAIEDFFRHTCDIYHASMGSKTAKYGLPSVEKVITFPMAPNLVNVPCFFGNSNTSTVLESEPRSTFQGANEISLPNGTEIFQGDKVIDKRFNIEYTADFPEDIRGKYLSVPLYRRTVQEAL